MAKRSIYCRFDKMVSLNKLKPHPKNPNKHPKKQIELLAKIMRDQGIRHPIIVSKRSKLIIKGHGRLDAAKFNKWDDYPVEYQSYKSAALEYADMIADNKIAELAELDLDQVNKGLKEFPDLDLDLLGIPDFKLEEIKEGLTDQDEIPEVNKKSKIKLGDVYQLGAHRLMCGDSTNIDEVEKLMEGQKADMVFTDPPYNQSNSGGGMADKRPGWAKHKDNNLSDFQPNEFLNVLSILTPLTVYIFCSKNLLKQYFQWIEDEKRKWDLLVMRKKNPIPLKNNKFLTDTEWLVFTRSKGAIFNNDLDFDWYRRVFDTEVKASEFGHPTEKRVAVPERFIKISSRINNKILDLFGGSGSTLIACEKTNRKCYMMEIEPKYCDVIIKRWEDYTGNKAEKIDNAKIKKEKSHKEKANKKKSKRRRTKKA